MTTLLYSAETMLLNELRHEGFVQESKVEDPPDGVMRVFHKHPICNITGQWDEEKPEQTILAPGMIYIVKAVAKPTPSPANELEFGIQRRHVRLLKEVAERYKASTPDKDVQVRVYWYIERDGQFRYIDLNALESLGRVMQADNIHDGGTVFIQVYKTAPMRDYQSDPYYTDRQKFMAAESRPEARKEWFT